MHLSFLLRIWLKGPRLYLSLFIILSFGIGIAVLTTAFGLIQSALISGSPFGDEARIVSVDLTDQKTDHSQGIALADIDLVIESVSAFEHASPLAIQSKDLLYKNDSNSIAAGYVQPDFFNIYNVQPVLGRVFSGEDVTGGNRAFAVLSFDIWTREFGGQADVLGAICSIAGEDRQVIGVMPKGFSFPWNSDVWIPLNLNTLREETGHIESARLCAKLAKGSTIEIAETQMATLLGQLKNTDGSLIKDSVAPNIFLWKLYYLGDYAQSMLLVLYLFAVFIFIVGVGNATILTSTGVVSRLPEFATRLSLGASRSSIIKQIFSECIFLNGLGSLAGIGIFFAVTRIFESRVADSFSESWINFSFGLNSFFHYAIVFAISTAISALIASYRLRKTSLYQLTQQIERTASTFGGGTFARIGISCQVFVAVVAVSGALLVNNGISSVIKEGSLFTQTNIATTIFAINNNQYPTLDDKETYLRSIEEALDRVPSVRRHSGSIDWYALRPLPRYAVEIDGNDCLTTKECPQVFVNVVRGDYFKMADAKLLSGRFFNAYDTAGAGMKTIVNQSFAKKFYPDASDAIGNIITLWAGQKATIIGIVEDLNMKGVGSFTSAESNVGLYLYQEQSGWGHIRYFIEHDGNIGPLREQLNAALISSDNDKRLNDLVSYRESQGERLQSSELLLSVLSFAAIIIAAFVIVSIYAFTSYLSHLKKKEIGIRMTYGASLFRIILLYGSKLSLFIASGVVIGSIAFVYGSRQFEKLLPDNTGYFEPILFSAILAIASFAISVTLPLALLSRKRIADLIR